MSAGISAKIGGVLRTMADSGGLVCSVVDASGNCEVGLRPSLAIFLFETNTWNVYFLLPSGLFGVDGRGGWSTTGSGYFTEKGIETNNDFYAGAKCIAFK